MTERHFRAKIRNGMIHGNGWNGHDSHGGRRLVLSRYACNHFGLKPGTTIEFTPPEMREVVVTEAIRIEIMERHGYKK